MSNIKSLMTTRHRNIPFRISLIYAFFSALWIIFSDRILLFLIDDVNLMTMIQTLKGWLFILITTLLIFNLLRREIVKVKKLEEQLIQNEKMISISHLATGMANQINNPLAGIVQNAQLVRNRLTKKGPSNMKAAEEAGVELEKIIEYAAKREIGRIVNSIVVSGREASELIENMLTFSQESSRDKENKDPRKLLDSTIELLKKDSRFSNVRLEREYGEVPMLRCDPPRIRHAFFHILSNSMEAMVENGMDEYVKVRIRVLGKKVEFLFEDKGPGMTDKVKGHIFEPFFTTREGAKGLGLAIANFIITDIHKGKLTVESQPGQGSRFFVVLPLQ